MIPLAFVSFLAFGLELLGVKLVWNTAGERAATICGGVVVLGNLVVLASFSFRNRVLTALLLCPLILTTILYPLFLQARMMLVGVEVARIIKYAEGVKSTTGGYPNSLASYGFRWKWTSAYLSYSPGFRVDWWGVQPGVSHWYTPNGGYAYYPD